MKKVLPAVLVILLVSAAKTLSQPVVGFWEITEVTMGDQTMTPVAKWTRINADHTYESGNGWLQNSVGSWQYDVTTSQFQPVEKNGIKDEFGPFKVSVSGETMHWKREENGSWVTVTLKKSDTMPRSTADKITGLWDLSSVSDRGKDVTKSVDPDGARYLFMRWDRIYMERTAGGKQVTGYWHINAHQPQLTLISHTKGKNTESWQVKVNNNRLELSGISNTNGGKEMIFIRIHEFPD